MVVTEKTFAAITPSGGVIAWGEPEVPGSSTSSVAEQLQNVIEITPSDSSFAALKEDGSVICWGANETFEPNLKQVLRVFAASEAFAALCCDGSVYCWGDPHRGGDMRGQAEQLQSEVEHIFATGSAFCALKASTPSGRGAVVAWGDVLQGAEHRKGSKG